MLLLILLFICDLSAAKNDESVFYHSYYGHQLTDEELMAMDQANTTFWCAVEVTPCDQNEGRRPDGTCNNLNYPSRGAGHTPFMRELPADFEYVNFVWWKPYCCEEKGKSDRMCTPIKVPDDDPVHRFSNVRCLNLTRPMTYQHLGCVDEKKISEPKRITSATVFFDMSVLYGNNNDLSKWRQNKSGLLKVEIEDDKIWPPSYHNLKDSICYLNQLPSETRCHATPENGLNTILGANLFGIWFWRYHNFFASRLAKLNPCWNDKRVFDTAKDINIAVYNQILYYELLPLLLGKFNMFRDNLISIGPGFRDIYDETLIPQQSLEFSFGLRYFHGLEEGHLNMYDKQGNYLRKMPVVNMTLRTGYLAMNNHLADITQGSYRQPCAKIDAIVDPDIAEIALSFLQRCVDITASDLAKGRLLGIPAYIHYRKLCSGKPVYNFVDLYDVMDPEYIDKLKDLYEDVEDVDLLLGIWLERPVQGGSIPSTLACLMTRQLYRSVACDRHWYEREDRPNAFTYEQLTKIRKATIARLLCDVGDSVKNIQPYAFLRAGFYNPIQSCKSIPKINIGAWKDPECDC